MYRGPARPPKSAGCPPRRSSGGGAAAMGPEQVVVWLGSVSRCVPTEVSRELKAKILQRRIDGRTFSEMLNECCAQDLGVDHLSTLHMARMRKAWHGDFPDSVQYRTDAFREQYPTDREQYPNDREQYPNDREQYPTDREQYPGDSCREQVPNPRAPVQSGTTACKTSMADLQWTPDASTRGRAPRDAQRMWAQSSAPVPAPEHHHHHHHRGRDFQDAEVFDSYGQHALDMELNENMHWPPPHTHVHSPPPTQVPKDSLKSYEYHNSYEHQGMESSVQSTPSTTRPSSLASQTPVRPHGGSSDSLSMASRGLPPALLVVVVDRLAQWAGFDRRDAIAQLRDVVPKPMFEDLAAIFQQSYDSDEFDESPPPRQRGGRTSSAKQISNQAKVSERNDNRWSNDTCSNESEGEVSTSIPSPQPERRSAAAPEPPRSRMPESVMGSHQDDSSRTAAAAKPPAQDNSCVKPSSSNSQKMQSSLAQALVHPQLAPWVARYQQLSPEELEQKANVGRFLLTANFSDETVDSPSENNSNSRLASQLLRSQPSKLPESGVGEQPMDRKITTQIDSRTDLGSLDEHDMTQGDGGVGYQTAAAATAAKGKKSSGAARQSSPPGAGVADSVVMPKGKRRPVAPKRQASMASSPGTRKASAAGAVRSADSVAAWVRALPPSQLPDKERERLATSVVAERLDSDGFTKVVRGSGLASLGVQSPAQAMKVRKAWDQVLREDECRQVAAETFQAQTERKAVKLVL